MPYDYEQHLSDKLQTLYFRSEQYKPLRQLIESDKDLVFAVRKNEIHIYYLGGRILKIKGSKNLRCCFELTYAKKKRGSKELNEYGEIIKMLNDNPYDIDLWIKNFDVLKRSMENFRKNVSPCPERRLQQILELENRDFNGEVVVIDNEYGVRKERDKSSKLCKVDLVTLYQDSAKYKICLIELKYGSDAIEGNAGIADHIGDYERFLNYRRKDIIASVNNLVKYKKRNGYLHNVPDNFKLDEEDTEICVSILCYDLPERQRNKVLSIIEESKKAISFELHQNIDLDSRCHMLTKKVILGE